MEWRPSFTPAIPSQKKSLYVFGVVQIKVKCFCDYLGYLPEKGATGSELAIPY